jgi:glycosyltransferase involved in cell wall biosynthesis
MAKECPKVSVCIPTYNRAEHLPAALNSVLQQCMHNFEVVIYDDASTDDTAKIIEQYPYERLRYFRQPANVGIARNRNSCLAAARGKYIAWLDSDDVYLPAMLETQSAVLDTHPQVGLVHGGFGVIDSRGALLPKWQSAFDDDIIEPNTSAFRELLLGNYISTPTVMVRRECYDRVGGYATELANYCEDWDIWLRIASEYDIAYTATELAQVRWHAGSASRLASDADSFSRHEQRTISRFDWVKRAARFDGKTAYRQAQAALAARAVLRAGDAYLRNKRRAALSELSYALRAAPWLAREPRFWRLILATIKGPELSIHLQGKALLKKLCAELQGTRYGEALTKQVDRDRNWDAKLQQVARRIRSFVPPGVRIAVVDKWDPTLLALSGRSGWHFPDLELRPEGYPANSEEAIQHLLLLVKRGAEYFVVPAAYRWWLDHYQGFREYLEQGGGQVCADEFCFIYNLAGSRELHTCKQAENERLAASVPAHVP